MKRFLLIWAATFTMVACQQDIKDVNVNEGEVSVSLNIKSPNNVARAFSDGTTATHLQYAIYDAEGVLLTALQGSKEIIGSTTIDLKLVNGNTYYGLFWAAAEDAPYTVDFTTKSMTVDYTSALSNDEKRDAFYSHNEFKITGATTIDVVLKRPFAQLNIGSNDYTDAANAGYDIKQVKVEVPVYTSLNLETGAVDGQTTQLFDYANIPTNENFPVSGYDYLAMNYLLVAADKETVDVVFTYTDGVTPKSRTVGSVPVQRNYRTNIYGQLFTGDVTLDISIEPNYDEPSLEANALLLAAAIGGEVTLTDDVVLTEPLEVVSNMTINLNGKTISNSTGYVIENYADLTISGEGALSGLGGIRSHGGKVTINGGSYTCSSDWNAGTFNHILKAVNTEVVINDGTFDATIGGTTNAMINVSENALMTINGGTFKNVNGVIPQFAPYLFTYESNGKLIINGGDFYGGWRFNGVSATTDIYGGSFAVSYDGQSFHAASTHILTIYGGRFSLDNGAKLNPADFLAPGYKVIEKDGYYFVVTDEIDAVAETLTELKDALANGSNVVLTTDVAVASSEVSSNGYGATGISQQNGGVIDGNGNSVSVDAWNTWDSAINTTGGTIKNVRVSGGFRGIFINQNGTNNDKVVLENVTIDGTVYTISCDQGSNSGLEATSCVLNGWTSYAATIGEVVFTDCSFGKGQGYAFCRPYAATRFVNCDFASGFEVDPQAAITFENCRLGGVTLTSGNIGELCIDNLQLVTVL